MAESPISGKVSMSRVWVLTHACGWSRMVPRSTPTDRRKQIIEEHIADVHESTERES